VFVHSSAATPIFLVQAMTRYGLDKKLSNVEVIHIQTEGDADYAKPECEGQSFAVM
jgi:4-hydroxybutyrate CoA-transferase